MVCLKGCLLIQLLSAWGAHVTVTAPRHVTMSLRDMGNKSSFRLVGEGCLLIQLLSAWGAHVTVTAPRHATMSLRDMGSQDYLDLDGSVTPSWLSVEQFALNKGPWDALLLCGGLACPPKTPGSHAAVLNAAETARRINDVYGDGVAKENTVRFWFQHFRSGNFDLQNKPRGRPETKVDNEELKAIVEADPSQTTSELAAGSGVSDKTILIHLKQIGKVKKLVRATAPRNNIVELRPKALLSDRLAAPFTLIFAASFYTYRVMRWLVGLGSHTDWLENQYHLRDGLATLAQLVDNGQLTPVLDKVFLPQDFESALAHACSEDAIGTTVIRFP
ncbi:unnamed protein product [Plutella xylostella]|uniref:(diamondback moth) hypothetical protein n=1 Tax=Plutella xylostella TaxID=51655 RepID=A0A8S4FT99_PLUXY|nr:unnamed protein product [Plutella xylostella]